MTEEEYKERVYAGILSMIDDAMAAHGKEMAEARLKELADSSRDERIRERLIEYFEGFKIGNANVKWEGLAVDDVLAWLKKLKPDNKIAESKFIVFAGKSYEVLKTIRLPGGIVSYMIEDEPGHFDWINNPDRVVSCNGYRIKERGAEFPSGSVSFRVEPIRLSREQKTILSDIIEKFNGKRRAAMIELYNELKKAEVQRPELTWRDVRRIIDIADRLIEEKPEEELIAMGEKGFYEEVLRRFNERRKNNARASDEK